MNYELNNY